jgi:S1-C subfamily serine protease
MDIAIGPNVLDAVLLLLLVLVALRGWRQGAVSQLAAFAGLAVGLFLGVWAAPLVAGVFFDEPGAGTGLVTLVVLLVAVLVGQGAGLALGVRLHRRVHRLRIGGADRASGVVVGVGAFLLAVWLLAGVLVQGPFPALSQQIRGSQVVAALDRALPPAPAVVGRIAAYLDRQGFPQVFAGPGRGTALPSAPPPGTAAVQAATAAGQPSTVQVLAFGCGYRVGAGSGFVTRPGFVVTNAHVVAGFGQPRVRDAAGEHPATVVGFNPRLDVAVLAATGVEAPPLAWADTPARAGAEGATLGFPGGQRQLVVRPATVQGRLEAVGRDIYGSEPARREILVLGTPVEQGDSGGPFVTGDGRVGGVVFAGDPGEGSTGYALTAEEVRPEVEAAIAQGQEVGVGECRF